MSIKAMHDLRGRMAVVIGGARDLGYDMAELLAAAGCGLALTSRGLERAAAAAERLRRAELEGERLTAAPLSR